MRSGLAAALMGIGGIFAAFGATVFVIAIFTRMNDWRTVLPTMVSVGTATLVIGIVMFAAGWLLGRVGGRETSRA